VRRLAVLLLVLAVLAGCGTGGEDPPEPRKVVDERGMRTDLEPLTRGFPAIGEPRSAQWQSGTLGDGRSAPGPSTHWIDGVVELDPQVADRLRLDAGPPAGTVPDLTPDIVVLVPDGRLASVDGLGQGQGAKGWSSQSWLVEGTDTLLISAVGE
jgi:hypothetical protein